ncbi:MAG: cobalamin-dependent protein, partial [Phycisphaerae bacterium]
MRTLLVAANRERSPFPVAPIGALSVASAARVAGFEVDLIDLSIVRAPARALRTALRTNHYDAVGLSIRNLDNCLYARPRSYFDDIAWIVCELRRASDAPLILGGSGFSIAPREWLVRLDADYGAVGEGEHTFVALLRRLAGKESTRGLDGVISREDVMEARCHRCPVY